MTVSLSKGLRGKSDFPPDHNRSNQQPHFGAVFYSLSGEKL